MELRLSIELERARNMSGTAFSSGGVPLYRVAACAQFRQLTWPMWKRLRFQECAVSTETAQQRSPCLAETQMRAQGESVPVVF